MKERKGERPARRVGITIRVFQSWEEEGEDEEEEVGGLLSPSSEASSFLEPIFSDSWNWIHDCVVRFCLIWFEGFMVQLLISQCHPPNKRESFWRTWHENGVSASRLGWTMAWLAIGLYKMREPLCFLHPWFLPCTPFTQKLKYQLKLK